MRYELDTASVADYQKFLRIKSLPHYRFRGTSAFVPDEYDRLVTGTKAKPKKHRDYQPSEFLFDYQRDITAMAIRKRKFSVFADCGLGKTLIQAEWLRHVASVLPANQCALIVSPLMVIPQTLAEVRKFYGDSMPIEAVSSGDLQRWLDHGDGRIGITNYEAFSNPIERGRLGAMALDESSMLKSHYGKWGTECVRLGQGLDWKLCSTGTPAPNDRIEYANHAVFMDAFTSVNSFLARFFVNRGQTDDRWEMKHHAIRPFYRALSHWSIFLTNPATYGWTDNTDPLPPIIVHRHRIDMTQEQHDLTMDETQSLFADNIGGITSRSVLSQIGKGSYRGKEIASHKPAFIRDLVNGWPDESTIVWCHYNNEQDELARQFPDAANISGNTPHPLRTRMIDDFKAGRVKVLISKPRILGFGLNLQVATRQVFSGLQDSYEEYYQAVKRSNRYGATRPLNVHLPYTDIEWPMIQNVMRKAHRVAEDTREQEELFRECGHVDR